VRYLGDDSYIIKDDTRKKHCKQYESVGLDARQDSGRDWDHGSVSSLIVLAAKGLAREESR